jgi:hypothetical protein
VPIIHDGHIAATAELLTDAAIKRFGDADIDAVRGVAPQLAQALQTTAPTARVLD